MENKTMSIKNGDLPAMPISYDARMMAAYSKGEAMGLTKREQFAMAAMQALLSNSTVEANVGIGGADNKSIAECSIALADALLAELERTR